MTGASRARPGDRPCIPYVTPGSNEAGERRERERALLGTMSITGWSRARPGDRRCMALSGAPPLGNNVHNGVSGAARWHSLNRQD